MRRRPSPAPRPAGRVRERGDIHPHAMCSCGHMRASHLEFLPAPCDHGRTMPEAELIARACDPTLTDDPRYGCKCIGFSDAEPS